MTERGGPSSELLMARYQARLDAEAFQLLVGRFLAPALAVARRTLLERSLAEDAVQEAFLRVIRCRQQYRATMPFANWFYSILRNVCRDMIRRDAARSAMLQRLAASSRSQGGPPSAEAQDLWALLAGLPEDSRVVLELRVVEGLPFSDVAAALGISEEAAKKRAQRALRRLREQWLAHDAASAEVAPDRTHSPAQATHR